MRFIFDVEKDKRITFLHIDIYNSFKNFDQPFSYSLSVLYYISSLFKTMRILINISMESFPPFFISTIDTVNYEHVRLTRSPIKIRAIVLWTALIRANWISSKPNGTSRRWMLVTVLFTCAISRYESRFSKSEYQRNAFRNQSVVKDARREFLIEVPTSLNRKLFCSIFQREGVPQCRRRGEL